MITFLLEEGIISATTISSIFTVGLVNSLRTNIIEPAFEKFIPTHKLHQQDNFNILPVLTNNQPPGTPASNVVKWKVFLKDFFIWLILMLSLFILWKNFLHPIKSNITKK